MARDISSHLNFVIVSLPRAACRLSARPVSLDESIVPSYFSGDHYFSSLKVVVGRRRRRPRKTNDRSSHSLEKKAKVVEFRPDSASRDVWIVPREEIDWHAWLVNPQTTLSVVWNSIGLMIIRIWVKLRCLVVKLPKNGWRLVEAFQSGFQINTCVCTYECEYIIHSYLYLSFKFCWISLSF